MNEENDWVWIVCRKELKSENDELLSCCETVVVTKVYVLKDWKRSRKKKFCFGNDQSEGL